MEAAREQLKALAGFCEKTAVAVLSLGVLKGLFDQDGLAYLFSAVFGWAILVAFFLMGLSIALIGQAYRQ